MAVWASIGHGETLSYSGFSEDMLYSIMMHLSSKAKSSRVAFNYFLCTAKSTTIVTILLGAIKTKFTTPNILKERRKTYNSWYSLVVTHPTTNQLVVNLFTAGRTISRTRIGSPEEGEPCCFNG